MPARQTAIVLDFEGHRLHASQRVGSELLWFVLADVCEILGLTDVEVTSRRLDEDQKGASTIRTLGGKQQMLIVSEDAVYAIALTSRKPIAKRFARWLYREVLPDIRRTGSYHGGSAPLDALIGTMQTALPFEPVVIPFKELDADDVEARNIWRDGNPNSEKRAEHAYELSTWSDLYKGQSYPIRLRYDQKGRPLILFIGDDRAPCKRIPPCMVQNCHGQSQVTVRPAVNVPWEVIERNFLHLGKGEYTAISLATLAHWYRDD
jgi:prophage antirepressor-like protein